MLLVLQLRERWRRLGLDDAVYFKHCLIVEAQLLAIVYIAIREFVGEACLCIVKWVLLVVLGYCSAKPPYLLLGLHSHVCLNMYSLLSLPIHLGCRLAIN